MYQHHIELILVKVKKNHTKICYGLYVRPTVSEYSQLEWEKTYTHNSERERERERDSAREK
jgi:hypothetical protein